jgi:hypothetical protein
VATSFLQTGARCSRVARREKARALLPMCFPIEKLGSTASGTIDQHIDLIGAPGTNRRQVIEGTVLTAEFPFLPSALIPLLCTTVQSHSSKAASALQLFGRRLLD